MSDIDTMFKVGDKVKLRSDVAGRWHGITFTIDKFLKKNVDLSSPHAPKGLRAPLHFLVPADQAAEVATIPFEPSLPQGTLVMFQGKLYVVIAQNARSGRYRIVKLGGDGGRYYTNVVRSHMTVIDPVRVKIDE